MRLIDADALELRVEKFEQLTGMKLDIVHDFVGSAPTIDAESVVHGEWLERIGGISKELFYQCSKCYGEVDTDEFDYCPWCGAKMGGERNNNE